MRIIICSFFLTLIFNSSSCSTDNSNKTSYDTNAHNDLFNQFKEYSESNPTLRRGSWTESHKAPSPGYENSEISGLWLQERNLQEGYDSERGFFLACGISQELGLIYPVLSCLCDIAAFLETEISVKNGVIESRVKSKLFGLSILCNEFMDENTYKTNYEIKFGTRSLKYSLFENEDKIQNEIQEDGLSSLELLKYLHHHANISLHIFKLKRQEKKGYEYAAIIITKITGQSSPRYSGSRVKMWEGTFDGGKLMQAVAWKPDGEKCPISDIKDGNGVLVAYNSDGKEHSRTAFKDGKEVKD
jgi:hypothetical protein